ncbi:MAG: hypothetical protein R3F14_35100 [Polyangiaceae bacterium]
MAFFHDRTGPVRAAIRVFVTYRVRDVGLVLAAILLHRSHHSTASYRLPAALSRLASQLAAALSRRSRSPSSSRRWASRRSSPSADELPRAMEGPTASSAALLRGPSVHAGVFLLVRAAPRSTPPAARVVVIVVGAATAVMPR